VTLGSESIELTTGKLKERSELKAITLALKQLAGAP
jgi:hypothetical protein